MGFINRDVKRIMFLIFFGIFIWWLFSNMELVGKYIGIFIGTISPLIIGFIISFILNIPMMFFERNILINLKIKDKYRRILSLLLTLVVFLFVITMLIIIIIPNLIEAGIELSDKLPSYIGALGKYIEGSTMGYSKFNQWIEGIDMEQVKDNLYAFIRGGFFDWASSTFSIASSVFSKIISFFIGLIFSIYFLLQKEELINGIKKLLAIILPIKAFNKTIYIGKITSKAFSDFIRAQSIESMVLGGIFFLSMILFKLPYATMISVVIAVSSIVPMVGAFIGLFVGIILIFVENPQLAGLFIILFLILQQIEGNLIYPRVVGKLSGLSPLLTLVAVTLGGSLMGVLGMILFVPIFSVLQKLVSDFMENASKDLN